ncbi:Pyrophosphate-energized vacuolar membrane proton pump 1 [Datura stramonium]|uniref:H(+)-exporting diphosphatase n=1 Tax=Datura stramonium TaxID=4076 RepID=A0ABS8RT52_DATST|nr:Pyrophosphate-energized vacuolar membrane proton pump 1 [Datura stramonium]
MLGTLLEWVLIFWLIMPESSCAALVVASISSFGLNHDFTAMCYPLLISSMGILVCLITTLFATDFFEIKAVKEIEPALKNQPRHPTALMTVGIAICDLDLPFRLPLPSSILAHKRQLLLCVATGLWADLSLICHRPCPRCSRFCRTGAKTNVIFGLALGYKSVIIPIFAIAIAIFVSFTFAAMYGIAVAALGMLSTIATGLAIDAYGPISDNAGAGNTTAKIGKGFAIGSAALVSLALFVL